MVAELSGGGVAWWRSQVVAGLSGGGVKVSHLGRQRQHAVEAAKVPLIFRRALEMPCQLSGGGVKWWRS